MSYELRNIPSIEVLEERSKQFPELDVLSTFAFLQFMKTAQEVSESFAVHFERFGLTEAKFSILMLLYRQTDFCLTPSEIAEFTGVTRATVTGLLDGLEKMEWIRRKPSPHDRRMLIVHLDTKGEKLLQTILPEQYTRTSKLMSELTEEEKWLFIELMKKMQKGTHFLREGN